MTKSTASKSTGLMTLFSVSALISVTAILAATFIGIRTIYTQNVIEIAEQQSVSISQALFIQERDLLTSTDSDGASTLRVSPDDFDRVDKRMHDYLRPFNIVKIKVFSKEKEIIYSTDPSIIGNLDKGNSRLDIALKGGVDAELGTKEQMVDLAHEERFDIDVVETYVPVTDQGGDVIGSFEIYMDVTRYRDRLAQILESSMVVIALILLGAFGLLALVMRRGTKRLHQYEQQLHELATTDVLTGVANRRHLLDRADEEFFRAQRDRQSRTVPQSVGCVMVDLDHFKTINDTHGHQVGDEVIREVAERLRHCVRLYDTVGRYGGEEFLIIIPDSAFEDVKGIAERVWQEIRKRPFETQGLSIDATVSVGFACMENGDGSISDVIKRADESLYIAKASGRDQVAWIASDQAA